MSGHGPETRAAVVADRAAGMKVSEVAAKHNVGFATVHRYAKAAGVLPDRSLVIAAAVEDYANCGESIRKVASRHPISQNVLLSALKAAGVPLRKGRGTAVEIKEKAVRDFLDGDPIRVVAESCGVSTSTVSTWLSAAGVSSEDREETDYAPVDYGGGWILRGGVKRPAKPFRKKAA